MVGLENIEIVETNCRLRILSSTLVNANEIQRSG